MNRFLKDEMIKFDLFDLIGWVDLMEHHLYLHAIVYYLFKLYMVSYIWIGNIGNGINCIRKTL
jgi:hypothetical protein